MSEALLKAILQIFALVAKEDGLEQQEIDIIKKFLTFNLSESEVPPYFEEFVQNTKRVDTENKEAIVAQICKKINAELTTQQKVIIVNQLVSIILADEKISDTEEALLLSIIDQMKLHRLTYERLKVFTLAKNIDDFNYDSTLFISEYDIPIADKHLKKNDLPGLIAIEYTSEGALYFIKHIGAGEIYLNGLPLPEAAITIFSPGSTIRGQKFEPIYYSDVISSFLKDKDTTPISFEARDILFKFKSGKTGLRDINIREKGGRLIGLMGASGAGKSTLLNVLNGSETPSKGFVEINGINIHKPNAPTDGVIGFVPQDDLLIEDLTVFQNMYYSAKLCFNKMPEKEINSLVIKTLHALGLTETKDLKVGSPLEKTISGGQRKRLNIGLELLREPAVMFVDEPTSGLSSRDSENIMDLLKELSLRGKLIFVVIHQPSSDIFKMFDKLIILDVGGYPVYYGNPVEAVVYFKERISLIDSQKGECIECGNVNPELIFNILEAKVVNEYGYHTDKRKRQPEQWYTDYKAHQKIPSIKPTLSPPPSSLDIPGRLKQVFLFAVRDVKAKWHNRQYMFINLLEAPVLAMLLAYIVRYYNIHDTVHDGYIFSKNINLPAYLFMSVIVALFMGLTVSAEEIIKDRKILKREKFLHLSRSSYILSKLLILFTLSAIQSLSFVIIGAWILEMKDIVLEHWFILFTTSCLANLIGLNISSSFNSAVTIYIIIPILLIPQLILSGVVVKFDKLNPSLASDAHVPIIGEFMASRWAYEASMVAQFKYNGFEKQFYIYNKIMAQADYYKIYYLPTLESKLEYCLNNFHSDDSEVILKMHHNYDLIQHELAVTLSKIKSKTQPELNLLNNTDFDSSVYETTIQYLEEIKKHYIHMYNSADQAKEKIIGQATATPEKKKAFDQFKNEHYNEVIAQIVKNQNEQHRIVEVNGQLIQKVFPIYMTPDPEHWFDFRDQFYTPTKHFMGTHIDTIWFNMGILWLMSIILVVTLYFDVLRKIIESGEKLFHKPQY